VRRLNPHLRMNQRRQGWGTRKTKCITRILASVQLAAS
jgi:hypothetical protein